MTHRATIRLTIFLLFIVVIGSFGLYAIWNRKGGAADILGMKGVTACSTARDFSGGKRQCPSTTSYVTTCDEAKAAVGDLEGIKLRSEISQLLSNSPDNTSECELKTISQSEGIYALVIHAYYPVESPSSHSLTDGNVRSKALTTLYSTYSNLYQSYLALDLTSASPTPTVSQSILYQPFSPGFLVKGEPGFRMSVMVQDEKGATKPGAGTLIRVGCGNSQDTMVAEPNGNSWFSFAGYEKLKCGNQPLTAQVLVQKDDAGHWISDTPTYSYLYEPSPSSTLNIQNRPQPVQVSFQGIWQGVGTTVQVVSRHMDGSSATTPLPKVPVSFTCDELTPPTGGTTSLDRTTDAQGKVSISLADAQKTLSSCQTPIQVSLTGYDPKSGAANSTDATYDYYFATPGPILASQISGSTVTGGLLEGNELSVGGTVRLANVGSTPGGTLTAGSTVCLFYTQDAAIANPDGCPSTSSATSLTIKADQNGQYLFGNSTATHLSYGDYLKAGANKMDVRIVNHKNVAYPASVVQNNDIVLDPSTINVKDITLPTSVNDLQDHVCQAVINTWNNPKECEPLLTIVFRESRWDVGATNSSSGACGLFQSNPCSKYQSTALPNEPYQAIGNQIRWGVQYIKSRYGTPTQAWAFWQANNHY